MFKKIIVITLFLFFGELFLHTNQCMAELYFTNPTEGKTYSNELDNVFIKLFVEFSDNNWDIDKPTMRHYKFDLYKGNTMIENYACTTFHSYQKQECNIDARDIEDGDDYRIKLVADNPPESSFTEYFSLSNIYVANEQKSTDIIKLSNLKVDVLENNSRVGGKLNVEFSSNDCTVTSIEPWLVSQKTNSSGSKLLAHVMNSDYNLGSVKTIGSGLNFSDHGGEFLRGYHAVNKKNFSFIVPSTHGFVVMGTASGIKKTVGLNFYASLQGEYQTEQQDSDGYVGSSMLGPVEDGNYQVFIKARGSNNGQKCVISGFSNYVAINNSFSDAPIADYVRLTTLSEYTQEMMDVYHGIKNIEETSLYQQENDETNIVVRPQISGANIYSVQNKDMYSRLKGKIMLKVEDAGKAYYVNPQSETMHYLGRPTDAFTVMREQGIGITNANLEKIPIGVGNLTGSDLDNDGLPDIFEDAVGSDKNNPDTDGDGYDDKKELQDGYSPVAKFIKLNHDYNFGNKQKGKIFLQVESEGEAWYVDPADGKRYFLGRPSDAFNVMRNLGLGISNKDFDSM